MRSVTNFGKSELQPRLAVRALDFTELPQGNRQLTHYSRDESAQEVGRAKKRAQRPRTDDMVHAVDVRQTGFGAHFVAAGQPCTGAPDFRATEHAAWDHTSPRVAQPPPCCSHSAALCTHRRLRPAPRRRPIKPLPWERSRSIPTMHRQSELPQKLLSRLIKLRRGIRRRLRFFLFCGG